MNKKIIIASALAATLLLYGCSTDKTSQSQSMSEASSEVSSEVVAAPSASPAAMTEYTAEDFDSAVKACYNFGVDTAGGSLKAASAAAGVVEFSAKYVNEENAAAVTADITKWYDALTDDEKADLKASWKTIYSNCNSIVTDYASVKALMSDAGVTTDFEAMNLENGMRFAQLINDVAAAQTK